MALELGVAPRGKQSLSGCSQDDILLPIVWDLRPSLDQADWGRRELRACSDSDPHRQRSYKLGIGQL